MNDTLDVSTFTIKTVPARLKKMGDLLKPLLGPGIDIKKVLKSIEAKGTK